MSKSPIKKPNIDYNPKRSVSYNKIEDNKIVFEPPVIDKNYLLKHLALAKENIEKTLEVFESSALQYAVTTNDLTVKSASRVLNSNVSNSQNITYPTYLYSLTQDGVSANLVSSVYETKSIGLWGNYSIKAIKLLDKSNKELDNIKSFLDSTEIENSLTYPIIMQNINVARGIAERLKEVRNPKLSILDIKKEYEGYNRSELIGVQVALNEQIIKVGEKIERDESLLKSEVSDTAKYYYDNIANRSLNSGITFANRTGKFSNIISNFIGLFDSEQKRINEDLTDRAIAFSEQASKIADDIVELATLQIYNQAIVEAGGAEEIDVVDTYRDLPDQIVVDNYIGQLSVGGATKPFISSVTDKGLDDIRGIFVEEEKFNSLKNILFWGNTTEINGGNIKAGSIEAGAIKIGDRPMDLVLTWGENQEIAGVDRPEVLMHLSHTVGSVTIEYNEIVTQFDILEAEVLTEDGSATPSIDETLYWIYLSLNDPADGFAKIVAQEYDIENKPEGDNIVLIGIWQNENGRGSLMTSYGSTIINGNNIMTGTVVADFIRVGTEEKTGDYLLGEISGIAVDVGSLSGELNTLEGNVYYPSTTLINGGNIQTGTVSAGALIIGERNISLTGKFSPNTTNGTVVSNGHLYYPGGYIGLPLATGEIQLSVSESDILSSPAAGIIYWVYADILGSISNGVFSPSSASLATVARTASSPYYGMPVDDTTDGANKHKYKKIGIWTTDADTIGTLALSLGQTFINGGDIKTGTLNADLVSISSDAGGVTIDSSGVLVDQGNFRMTDPYDNEIMLHDNINYIDDHSFEIAALRKGNYAYYIADQYAVDIYGYRSDYSWHLGDRGEVTGGSLNTVSNSNRTWVTNCFNDTACSVIVRHFTMNAMASISVVEETPRWISSNTSTTLTLSAPLSVAASAPYTTGSNENQLWFWDHYEILNGTFSAIVQQTDSWVNAGLTKWGDTAAIVENTPLSQMINIPYSSSSDSSVPDYSISMYLSTRSADPSTVLVRVFPWKRAEVMWSVPEDIRDNVGFSHTFTVTRDNPFAETEWKRYSVTIPKENIYLSADLLYIEISTTVSGDYVIIDGVQVSPNELPTPYNTEDSFMKFMKQENPSGIKLHEHPTSWTDFETTVTPGTGAYADATGIGKYCVIGPVCHFKLSYAINNVGSGSGGMYFDFPVTPAAMVSQEYIGPGREVSLTGLSYQVVYTNGKALLLRYDNTAPMTNGMRVNLSGTYEIDL